MGTGGKKADPRGGTDAVGIVAYGIFVAVGGFLVFCFAWMLKPAAAAQAEAACRPMMPEMRSGAAPDLALERLDGRAVKLSDYRGTFVVLNFWATWCEPCSREWPDLDKLAARLGERDDVAILAVSIDEDRAAIAPYIERLRLEATGVEVLWDPSAEAHKTYGSEKIPDTYFVDGRGDLRAAFVNTRAWGRSEGFRCVDAMARESAGN